MLRKRVSSSILKINLKISHLQTLFCLIACVVDGVTIKKGEWKAAPIGKCMKMTCDGKDKISALGYNAKDKKKNKFDVD